MFLMVRIAALITLVALAPLMLLIAAAVVVDSGWPVFFWQQRIGLHGRRFWMVKFRKFGAALGADIAPLTLAGDARFTRVGALLAQTKLDELPQLWNVIRGEMALVGPRPEVPEFESCFAGSSQQLLNYLPGIFGPSQVVFRAEAALYPPDRQPLEFYREVLFPAKAALDLAYYPARSALGDLKWVVRGIRAVCGRAPEGSPQPSARVCAPAAARPRDQTPA